MWRFNGYALTCPEGGIWGARSGGSPGYSRNVTYGMAGLAEALPEGPYLILRGQQSNLEPTGKASLDALYEKMFVPGTKRGWFVPLRPLFYTERGTPERGRFGIHPDGEFPGTNGCIGIFSGDYDRLFQLLVHGSFCMHLEVSYSCCCTSSAAHFER